jgi:hypothetical protein
VSDGDNFNFVTAEDVHQAERKSWKDVAPSATSMARPSAWILGDRNDRVP